MVGISFEATFDIGKKFVRTVMEHIARCIGHDCSSDSLLRFKALSSLSYRPIPPSRNQYATLFRSSYNGTNVNYASNSSSAHFNQAASSDTLRYILPVSFSPPSFLHYDHTHHDHFERGEATHIYLVQYKPFDRKSTVHRDLISPITWTCYGTYVPWRKATF
ncbi:uncharacterized protein EI90DRAFT_3027158 [Cantharellus anzutake]|uniref:uncharacterized protein n=1 Tax=Cantharellus anzutake TaxID=1750568 RepID=UPI0019037FBC|nr:uncharacterized protein EI90DRAFT_3027158 [Cantharellus anzutake]KAF8343803.1 hypothetical protein EI90DRAFT_3027158 [Cantharellus anzutake]